MQTPCDEGSSNLPFPDVSVSEDAIAVRLPDWLNSLLFDGFKAVHQPAKSKRSFDNNLGSSPEQVKIYLGTYFPRSFAESFVLFDSLLSDRTYSKIISQKKSISICSLGTGTGGDLLGTLFAIGKRAPACQRIEVTSIEGNHAAHGLMEELLDNLLTSPPFTVTLNKVDYTLEAPNAFQKLLSVLPSGCGRFDFVISSKMLNELHGANVSARPYYEFCSAFADRLEESGLLVALDVTSTIENTGEWTPILLNSQVNDFTKDNRDYKTILPLLCNRFEAECGKRCYTQNRILVTHRNATNACSRVCYRVIGKANFVKKLANSPALWDCPITQDNEKHCSAFLKKS